MRTIDRLHVAVLSFSVLWLGCAAEEEQIETDDESQGSSPEDALGGSPDALLSSCGWLGQTCCEDNECLWNLNCNVNAQVCTWGCGGLGEACCGVAQSCDSGLFCNWDRCAESCGELGQECCRPENRCFNGSTCNASTGMCE